MGRKRKGGKTNAGIKEDTDIDMKSVAIPDQESEEYFYDEIEQHALKKDKILLDADIDDHGNDGDEYTDEEDEIMHLDASDEDADDIEDESDNEEGESTNEEDDQEDGIPSSKAWGRKKSQFYDSDVKDIDNIGNDEDEQLAAEEEEKEALTLQQRMMSHLSQEDFDHFDVEVEPSEEQQDSNELEEESRVTKDLSKLSKEEIIEILVKESPELFELMDDYQSKMSEIMNKYHPLLLLVRDDGNEITPEGADFIHTMHQLLLNYCVNISFYLVLKAKNEDVKDHPVILRLLEYRDLISKFEPTAKKFEQEMEELLAKIKYNDGKNKDAIDVEQRNEALQEAFNKAKSKENVITAKTKAKKKKKNEKESKKSDSSSTNRPSIDPLDYYNKIANEIKAKKMKKKMKFDNDMTEDVDDGDDDDALNEDDVKRGITYEMSKNKGLIRKRKKELKNPRVKHKMKFKKAVVKRKSQIPLVRNEASNYGGELTGIKSNIKKSVKIK